MGTGFPVPICVLMLFCPLIPTDYNDGFNSYELPEGCMFVKVLAC